MSPAPTALLAKPTFWHVTQTGFGSLGPDFKLCTGERMLNEWELLKKKLGGSLPPCAVARSKNGDGSMNTTATCGSIVMRGAVSAAQDDIRLHLEMPQTGASGHSDKPRTFDAHYVRLGDCPANMKPGQVVMTDGQIIDPNAMLTAILDPAKALADAKADPENAPPPIAPVAVSTKIVRRRFELEKYDPQSCGHIKSSEPTYSFGRDAKRWDVELMIGVRSSGGPDVRPTIVAKDDDPDGLDTEPNYTLRLRTYAFTPPIAQQNTVRKAGPFSGKSLVREDARRVAKASGETYCWVNRCTLSDRDRDDFLLAFDEAARRGDMLTISGPGPDGAVTEEFSLQGLAGFIERTEACVKASS